MRRLNRSRRFVAEQLPSFARGFTRSRVIRHRMPATASAPPSAGRKNTLPWPDGDSEVAGQILQYVARNSKSPRSVAGDNEYLALIRGALAELDSSDRQLIQLRFIEQLPHAKIGARLGRTENAIKMLCLRAIRTLRSLMPES